LGGQVDQATLVSLVTALAAPQQAQPVNALTQLTSQLAGGNAMGTGLMGLQAALGQLNRPANPTSGVSGYGQMNLGQIGGGGPQQQPQQQPAQHQQPQQQGGQPNLSSLLAMLGQTQQQQPAMPQQPSQQPNPLANFMQIGNPLGSSLPASGSSNGMISSGGFTAANAAAGTGTEGVGDILSRLKQISQFQQGPSTATGVVPATGVAPPTSLQQQLQQLQQQEQHQHHQQQHQQQQQQQKFGGWK
ncbi:hypothetical protein HK101_007579, partial [Irineochytrium annulatum]